MKDTISQLLKINYSLDVDSIEKSAVGASSDTYFVLCQNKRYVVKFPCESDMNIPENEAELCGYLLEKGIPVSEFVKNNDGKFLSCDENGRLFHLQKFVEGKTFELNSAPKWFENNLENLDHRISAEFLE